MENIFEAKEKLWLNLFGSDRVNPFTHNAAIAPFLTIFSTLYGIYFSF